MPKQLPRVVEWNGKDLAKTMRSLPEGRYVIEEISPTRKLSAAEDEGLRKALRSVEAGRTVPAAMVHAQLRNLIKQKARKPARRPANPR